MVVVFVGSNKYFLSLRIEYYQRMTLFFFFFFLYVMNLVELGYLIHDYNTEDHYYCFDGDGY